MEEKQIQHWFGGEQKQFCLHWPAFILAFAVGIMYVYFTVPQKKHVVRFPTPYNAGKHIYKDDAGTCFVYKAKEVKCPTNPLKISSQPVHVSSKDE